MKAFEEFRKNSALSDEANRRAMREVYRTLRSIEGALEDHNYGTAADLLASLRESVDDEHGLPLLLARKLEEVFG